MTPKMLTIQKGFLKENEEFVDKKSPQPNQQFVKYFLTKD